jgi:hypothetical protein
MQQLEILISVALFTACRYRWPRWLRHGFAAARWLGLWVWIPHGAWTSGSIECLIFSSLCDGTITRPEESYRLRCVWVWSRNINNEEVYAQYGCRAIKQKFFLVHKIHRNKQGNRWSTGRMYLVQQREYISLTFMGPCIVNIFRYSGR